MMRLLNTLMRGLRAEAEEAVFDANAIRLLEQHVREATAAYELAKRELAAIMAEEARQQRTASEVAARIGELESETRTVLGHGDRSEAERLAARIATLTDERTAHVETAAKCAAEARRMRTHVEAAALRIAEVRRGLAAARAAEALHRAKGRLGGAAQHASGALREAEETLKRIRARHQCADDLDEVEARLARELPDADPGAVTREPRRTDPKDVLARLMRDASGPSQAA